MIISKSEAIHKLNAGNVVCLPTETVYGLAAKHNDETAIRKIYCTKQRPANKPLILHIGNPQWISRYCHSIPSYVTVLANHFWPGPLTLILPKNDTVSDLATAQHSTIGIRMPNHPVTLDIINSMNEPVFAPSANLYQKISPTRAEHIFSQFGNGIDVVDGGDCVIGIESTIVYAADEHSFSILRPGHISLDQIQKVIDIPHANSAVKVTTSGQDKIHYMPNTKMLHFNQIEQLLPILKQSSSRFKVMTFEKTDTLDDDVQVLMPYKREQYEQMMYDSWFQNDLEAIDTVYIQLPPNTDAWQGVRDKILKASQSINSKSTL